jgi:Tfp pilus assembly protein PilE
MSDFHPELSDSDSDDDQRPLRSKRMLTVMRVVVVLGVLALILPGVITTLHLAKVTAANACLAAVARYYPLAESNSSRFELAAPAGSDGSVTPSTAMSGRPS